MLPLLRLKYDLAKVIIFWFCDQEKLFLKGVRKRSRKFKYLELRINSTLLSSLINALLEPLEREYIKK